MNEKFNNNLGSAPTDWYPRPAQKVVQEIIGIIRFPIKCAFKLNRAIAPSMFKFLQNIFRDPLLKYNDYKIIAHRLRNKSNDMYSSGLV